ncbi:hypothetical protein ACFQLX_01405 [Streptomyces polyrhachis]|uniref:Uncharacterized protein n=1 Tax=Streptomyces polyrhachis TaxID=1282885 RepID=A0ABW2G7S3_9ACTN
MRDALHFSGDGGSYDVQLDASTLGGLRTLDRSDLLTALDEPPGWQTSVGGLAQLPLEGGDVLWGGEGAYGSDGFVARVRPDESLV